MTRVRFNEWFKAKWSQIFLLILTILNINMLEEGPQTAFFKVQAQHFHFGSGGFGGGFGGGGGGRRR